MRIYGSAFGNRQPCGSPRSTDRQHPLCAEQSIRGFCTGKKNWVIIGTVTGAKSSAIICSIAETAKANNLRPYDYFEYLLTEIPKHLDDTDRSFCNDLLPWSPNLPAHCRKPNKDSKNKFIRAILILWYRTAQILYRYILSTVYNHSPIMNGMMNMIGNAYRVYPQSGDMIQINNCKLHRLFS